jgi:hypothetical protein
MQMGRRKDKKLVLFRKKYFLETSLIRRKSQLFYIPPNPTRNSILTLLSQMKSFPNGKLFIHMTTSDHHIHVFNEINKTLNGNWQKRIPEDLGP